MFFTLLTLTLLAASPGQDGFEDFGEPGYEGLMQPDTDQEIETREKKRVKEIECKEAAEPKPQPDIAGTVILQGLVAAASYYPMAFLTGVLFAIGADDDGGGFISERYTRFLLGFGVGSVAWMVSLPLVAYQMGKATGVKGSLKASLIGSYLGILAASAALLTVDSARFIIVPSAGIIGAIAGYHLGASPDDAPKPKPGCSASDKINTHKEPSQYSLFRKDSRYVPKSVVRKVVHLPVVGFSF